MAKDKFVLDTVFRAVDRITKPVSKIQQRVGRMGKRLDSAFKDANKAVNGAYKGLKTFGKEVAKVGAALGAAFTAAAYKIGSAGMDFEEAITAVGAVGLQTREQIADLEKEALRLGATTKFTATEAANAMETMARAGFSNQEILAGVGGVLDAAAASGLEIAEVANHVSNALKGMGLEVTDAATGMSNATRVADVLALASSRTNSSIGSLGESLKNVAGTASDLGMSIEDTIGAVALLQDVGLDASVAGSALNTMLTEIAAGSTEVSKRAKDAHGNMRSFPELLAIISDEAAKSGGNMDRVAYLADLVGLRGQKAATNLAKLFDSGKVASLTDELNKAAGSAQKMAELRMDNLKGDLTLLESAIDGVKVALYGLESGPLREVVQGMTNWVSANQELIVSGVKEFIQDVRDILPEIIYWGEKIAIIAAVFASVAAAIKVATVAAAVFNAVASANPILLIAIAIVSALALIIAFWPEITAFFAKLWDGIKDMASRVGSAVGGFIQAIWAPVKQFLVGVFEFVVGVLKIMFWPQIQMFKLLFGVIQSAAGWVMERWEPIKAFFLELWGAIVAGVTREWEKIKALAQLYFDMMKAIWDPLSTYFSMLWDSIAASFRAVVGPILDAVGWAVDKIREVGRETLGWGDAPAGADSGSAQMVSPSERVAHSISETTTTTKAEVTVKAPPGSAVTKPPKGNGFGLKVQPSGAM